VRAAPIRLRGPALQLLAGLGLLGGATILIAALEGPIGVPNADAVYLLAVVVMGVAFGTLPAVATAVGSFLLYDYFFVPPTFTLTVADPSAWLNLALLLIVGVVVGQLAALQRNRAEVASAREREARALFRVSQALAVSERAEAALPAVAAALLGPSGMSRMWIGLGPTPAQETVSGEAGEGARTQVPAIRTVLNREPGGPGEGAWVRTHVGGSSARAGARPPALYQVPLEAGERALGSIWALRAPDAGEPSREETRLLAVAANEIEQTLARDRLAAEAVSAEVARRSDAAKTALLDSVSHDLRTPLAAIRVAAGSLMDPVVSWPVEDVRSTAASIDREADRLNQLVTNLLDMSRLESGALKASCQVFPLDDLVAESLVRRETLLADRTLRVDVPPELPLVEVDPVFVDEILANILENAVRYTPPGATFAIHAGRAPDDGMVRLTIEDDGPGVPEEALPRLFEKFYRVPQPRAGSRRGTGMGLAVVRGLAEAMNGRVQARRGDLGGLAIDLDMPVASPSAPGSSSRGVSGGVPCASTVPSAGTSSATASTGTSPSSGASAATSST